ncbi:hypothetical protein SAMN04488029_3086 [Reichenbachiella faecimaris]|uniref:Uncharacterized protein n=1 Tax=Reichenbachiella faecimaris TaxID=692418 RepID=A0A1W2GJQ9_REIFA|nr:hypothetical protein [Reichenbachiella faecimaris]SMD36821.1 hypothetical protein SAMN04488029_3086 [Reichenbachiella faecimaris]
MKKYIIPLLILASCNAPKVTGNAVNQSDYKKAVEKKLGTPVTYEANESNTRVLCIYESEKKPEQPRNTVSFLVYDMEKSEIVYESSVDGGSVSWYDEDRIEIFSTPGYVRSDQTNDDFAKIHDLTNGKTVPKKEYLKGSE